MKIRNILRNFLKGEKEYPVIAAIAAGLYPILFYYSNNFTLVDSWWHLLYFLGFFLVVPILVFSMVYFISKKNSFLNKFVEYTIPFLNFFFFVFFMTISLMSGFQKKIFIIIFILSLVYVYFLYKHYIKFIIFQFLLSVIGFCSLGFSLYTHFQGNDDWKKPVDAIENITLIKKPNIYFIQPDGYVNFSELKQGYYQINNRSFEDTLVQFGFTNYPNFRSNYASTLYSNSATLMMQHHYYNQGKIFNEALGARDDIISKNTVLNILKNNGYKTHFISKSPYLLLNRPKIGFDYSNFDYNDFGFLATGFSGTRDVVTSLLPLLETKDQTPKFYFIEFFKPGHINGKKSESLGAFQEKKDWIKRLKESNQKLTDLILSIRKADKEALIIILADHGGFVGMDYTEQIYNKTQDRDIIYSMFSSQLSIHWPNGERPEIDEHFKSSVNVFRVLFSHLSNNKSYLDNLQKDESYVIIKKGAPRGIYKVIDNEGVIVFDRHE